MLQITDITLRIAGRPLIEQSSAAIPTGAKCGLVGRNGTGKTTLFKAITGELGLETGSIRMPEGTRIGQVAQEAPGTDVSLLDTVLAADTERTALLAEADTATDAARIADIHTRLADIDAHAAPARAGAILHGLGFDAEAQARPCKSFSGGWRMRVALAAVLFSEPDLLLLDEPTNYLDLEGTLWLENYLQRYRHTVLLISHDRDLLNNCTNQILHLEGHKLTLYRGNYDTFARTRAERIEQATKRNEKQAAKRRHMEAFVERFRAKATKARQAQSRLKALARMADVEIVHEDASAPFAFPSPERRAASPIIALEGASVGYMAGAPILKRLNLRIDADDRIALLGANGNGKSTFAKLISDRLAIMDGTITRADKLRVAMFTQHQLDDLVADWSAYDHFRARFPDEPEAKVRSRVAQTGLVTQKMDTKAASLSGGERARLVMGLIACERPHLLILDEPTNHLDIESRAALTDAINGFEGAVIIVSHDRSLLETTADRLWLVADGTVKAYDGDLDDYRQWLLRGPQAEKSDTASDATKSRNKRQDAAQLREQWAPVKARIDKLEAFIVTADADLEKIDARLADPTVLADGQRVTDLSRKRAMIEQKKAEAEEKWLSLSAEYEAGVSG